MEKPKKKTTPAEVARKFISKLPPGFLATMGQQTAYVHIKLIQERKDDKL